MPPTPPPRHETVDDVTVICSKLHPMVALEILPELVDALASGTAATKGVRFTETPDDKKDPEAPKPEFTFKDFQAFAPAFAAFARSFAGGKLRAITPKLLSTTIVMAPNATGTTTKYELAGGEEVIGLVFRERFMTLLKVVWIAIKVSFADFSSVAALFVKGAATSSSSKD